MAFRASRGLIEGIEGGQIEKSQNGCQPRAVSRETKHEHNLYLSHLGIDQEAIRDQQKCISIRRRARHDPW
jgi:hypothetical protein